MIHGLLADDPKRRWGTCASLPVLVAAVARRLGYPVGLVVAGRHIFARWDDGTTRFNIEASGLAGMTVPTDEGCRKLISTTLTPPKDEASPYYLRILSPAEEFGLFLTLRVELLIQAARYEETLLWSARALQLAPDDPEFPRTAYYGLDLAMKHRIWRCKPHIKIPPMDDPEPFFYDPGDILNIEERSLFLTISAHYKESKGQIDAARQTYEDACRQNFHGIHEQRDLQRFILKHGPSSRKGPPLPPKNLGQPRRLTLFCKPHEEAGVLRGLAAQFERDGELLKARDALCDLYMFDPADADLFHRAHAFEKRPEFQEQLKAAIAEYRRVQNQKKITGN